MLIKTALRFNLTPVRTDKNKNKQRNNENKCQLWSRESTCSLLMGLHSGAATGKIGFKVPQKTTNRSPNYTTLGYIPKGLYILLQRYLFIHGHCCSVDNNQEMKITYMSNNWWIDNKTGIFKEWNIIQLFKKWHSQKDKHLKFSLICRC